MRNERDRQYKKQRLEQLRWEAEGHGLSSMPYNFSDFKWGFELSSTPFPLTLSCDKPNI